MVRTLLLLSWLALAAATQAEVDVSHSAAEMAAARAAVKQHHGAQLHWMLLGERFELQTNEGDPAMVWEGQAWIGGDLQKFWLKSEAEYETEDTHLAELEIQALYSRAVTPFWDLQAGVRQDIKPKPSRSYGVIGLAGLAPYWFEVDAALFFSDESDVSVRLEAEYELRLTQRLLLQPRIELNGAFSADEEIGVGAGLGSVDFGLRLRYELAKEFAPYVGLRLSHALGDSADLRRAEGEDRNVFSLVAGVRFWF
ncbi:MAG: copper resistance protein B [Pseudomonadales bacterium]